jgi:hypothetical protein
MQPGHKKREKTFLGDQIRGVTKDYSLNRLLEVLGFKMTSKAFERSSRSAGRLGKVSRKENHGEI